MHPTLFYRPGALLSASELSAARIDGVLIEVGEGYMPPDVPEDAAARAASLRPVLAEGYALCGPTAAWVHGVGDAPPACHHLQRIVERRQRVARERTVILHERRIEASDIQRLGGVPVTTPARTLTDLVLGSDPLHSEWTCGLAALSPGLVGQVRELIGARHRMPGKRAALHRLAALAEQTPGYEEVTR
ncbi:type IV toxin-antitoxin system AbiEi family antitoxin [Microbacterium tenebrionis]|uniref:type IV toxin-antitoxin system AbiEi family antitoxin n=1 Tax=Microbacterium tenebrionis TaxID=2830665 RepID=UPI0015894793|nr:type IV toxin-antitoxin system AbiEi family antitoxin [Microbacterium ihumii]